MKTNFVKIEMARTTKKQKSYILIAVHFEKQKEIFSAGSELRK